MRPEDKLQFRRRTESIGTGAAEHLRFIRNTIEAAQTFTTIPGKGCIAMGLAAIAASVLEAYRQSVSQEVMRHMKYPLVAVKRKWQGKAVVEMQLSDDGSVTRLVVVESSGKEILDDAALEMIRDSLPLPKPPRGVRTVKVPVVFRLQG